MASRLWPKNTRAGKVHRATCAELTILETGSETRVGFPRKQQQEEPMSNQHSVTKRHRCPKSDKRADYTAQTMAAVKQLEQAAKLKTK
jgi:hypothetical protein